MERRSTSVCLSIVVVCFLTTNQVTAQQRKSEEPADATPSLLEPDAAYKENTSGDSTPINRELDTALDAAKDAGDAAKDAGKAAEAAAEAAEEASNAAREAAAVAESALSDGISIDDQGVCTVSERWEVVAYTKCKEALLPARPRILVQTPGSFIVGKAWGSDGDSFVFGPAVGLGATVSFPILSPKLKTLNAPGEKQLTWVRPESMAFILNWNLSINAGMTGLKLDIDDDAIDSSQLGFTAGIFTGPEVGVAWFTKTQDTTPRRVVLALGGILAYLGEIEGLGTAVLVGFQPALIIEI